MDILDENTTVRFYQPKSFGEAIIKGGERLLLIFFGLILCFLTTIYIMFVGVDNNVKDADDIYAIYEHKMEENNKRQDDGY